jgi:hypothetical protein
MPLYVVQLTDDSAGIQIAKSGAPEPDAEMLAWLGRECRGPWSWDSDGVFNVFFRFEVADDAACFKSRWSDGDV